ncbi:XK-related protein 8-like [Mastacembelus armatus]|uniref:XK-related protein n=1 Tax=Mastacembelus armatus TaxID=205130 RepID=A0A3Q3L0T6_9TELE|nr:XK-related protein 8-like [Mastacembelus armatus]
MDVFKFSPLDFLFTCLGLIFLLLDIGLDILAAVNFYQEKKYVSLGVLLLLLVASSVLVQAFSWLWYSYEDYKRRTKVEKCLSPGQLKLLHVFQLGIYFRHASVVETSVQSFFQNVGDYGSFAVYLSHDLSMLRLIETFSESAPQVALMLTIILQQGKLEQIAVLKALGSASAIAFSVTMYHRSLRRFLPDKERQPVISSVVYFFWNLILIASRITALALFASVLPCFVFSHFFCAWLVLFFCAWRSKTDFMDSPGGEWLYRGTVATIWYFNWFNVVEGTTRNRTLLYHGYILADISFLCSLWCWKIAYVEISPLYASITAVSVVAVYILGLLVKIIYYKLYHPNLGRQELKGDGERLETGQGPMTDTEDVVDSGLLPPERESQDTDTDVTFKMCSGPSEPSPEIKVVREDAHITDGNGAQSERASKHPVRSEGLTRPDSSAHSTEHCNKRMRKLAANFYS